MYILETIHSINHLDLQLHIFSCCLINHFCQNGKKVFVSAEQYILLPKRVVFVCGLSACRHNQTITEKEKDICN